MTDEEFIKLEHARQAAKAARETAERSAERRAWTRSALALSGEDIADWYCSERTHHVWLGAMWRPCADVEAADALIRRLNRGPQQIAHSILVDNALPRDEGTQADVAAANALGQTAAPVAFAPPGKKPPMPCRIVWAVAFADPEPKVGPANHEPDGRP